MGFSKLVNNIVWILLEELYNIYNLLVYWLVEYRHYKSIIIYQKIKCLS